MGQVGEPTLVRGTPLRFSQEGRGGKALVLLVRISEAALEEWYHEQLWNKRKMSVTMYVPEDLVPCALGTFEMRSFRTEKPHCCLV